MAFICPAKGRNLMCGVAIVAGRDAVDVAEEDLDVADVDDA